jgi:hypothetical protein
MSVKIFEEYLLIKNSGANLYYTELTHVTTNNKQHTSSFLPPYFSFKKVTMNHTTADKMGYLESNSDYKTHSQLGC